MSVMDREALYRACVAAPRDDTPRLVFCDWLEETGDPANADRARFIRRGIELRGLWADKGATEGRGLFIECHQLLRQYGEGWALAEYVRPMMLLAGGPSHWVYPHGVYDRRGTKASESDEPRSSSSRWRHYWEWSAGFIEEVWLTWEDWLRGDTADRIRACVPLRKVWLRTVPVINIEETGHGLGASLPGGLIAIPVPRSIGNQIAEGASNDSLLVALCQARWPGLEFGIVPGGDGRRGVPGTWGELAGELATFPDGEPPEPARNDTLDALVLAAQTAQRARLRGWGDADRLFREAARSVQPERGEVREVQRQIARMSARLATNPQAAEAMRRAGSIVMRRFCSGSPILITDWPALRDEGFTREEWVALYQQEPPDPAGEEARRRQPDPAAGGRGGRDVLGRQGQPDDYPDPPAGMENPCREIGVDWADGRGDGTVTVRVNPPGTPEGRASEAETVWEDDPFDEDSDIDTDALDPDPFPRGQNPQDLPSPPAD